MSISNQTLTAAAFAALIAAPATAEQLINDNLIVTKRSCVGSGCVSGESFDLETLRLKDSWPVLRFEDSSPSGGTDSVRDWEIQANDAQDEFFRVNDLGGEDGIFYIEPGARANAIRIDEQGQIGLGTSLPLGDLHIRDGGSTSIYLETDGSGGGTPQSYSLSSNEFGLTLYDHTASTLPLFIDSDAGTAALYLRDGGAGFGTTGPAARMHVAMEAAQTNYPHGLLVSDMEGFFLSAEAMAHILSAYGNAELWVEELAAPTKPRTLLNLRNNGRPEIVMSNTATNGEWSFGAGTDFVLKVGTVNSLSSAKTKVFTVKGNGDAILAGSLTTGGTTCGGGCDRVFTEGAVIEAGEYANRMWAQGHLPHVGPTEEGAPLNVSEKLGGMLNALEHAHVFIAEQRDEIAGQKAEIAALKADKAETGARLARLEALVLAQDRAD